jgi:hypothetical protein
MILLVRVLRSAVRFPDAESAMHAPEPPSNVKRLCGAYAVANWPRERCMVGGFIVLIT